MTKQQRIIINGIQSLTVALALIADDVQYNEVNLEDAVEKIKEEVEKFYGGICGEGMK